MNAPFDALENCYFTTRVIYSAAPDDQRSFCYLDASVLARHQLDVIAPDRSGLIPAQLLAGKFWWVSGPIRRIYPDLTENSASTYEDCQSTLELFRNIRQGFHMQVIEGPFETMGAAEYAVDVAWEAPD